MTLKEVRLSWDESQKHYLALDEIENKHMEHAKTKGQKKKSEVKVFNEKNEYLRVNELRFSLGGFYKTVMVSDD